MKVITINSILTASFSCHSNSDLSKFSDSCDVVYCFVFFKQDIERGVSYLKLRPDRVAMQDATAQVKN